ncbi:endonuclease/exonuclease/phosphatase family protein [Rubellicoccus peritrichatus]|uniref:Endonuclease/exonuclease/phosphatase family protein n=1 Tax=Rubellicoccus peritrichatus TaxID=3080537 RepID=A0AAQ3L5U7_9BACT|nr:endonuclease/exonuclease/phosphatase family protein [Puniceicoccus sp. CR14]WOO39441.1 endonuclease/exonuclease/phosphatase family protein [Puniceicoccus sp. CR14]
MAKAFSVASWNVEHFQGKKERVKRVVKFLKDSSPDVFAIFEVKGKDVFAAMTAEFPGYSFHITEGPQTQEILVAAKSGLTPFFTQKVEFKGGNPFLRPGALLTIQAKSKTYTLLFLHTKSLPDPKGFGLRDFMLEKAIDFNKILKKATGAQEPNYLFMGDLNTMGMNYKFSKYDIPQTEEIARLDRFCKARGLRRLSKTFDETYGNFNRSKPLTSDLDHVVASEHLQFRSLDGKEIKVSGWNDESTLAKKKAWTEKYSDHNMLYFEVMD